MNQENQLTEQNSEETEIDLLEIFYLLRKPWQGMYRNLQNGSSFWPLP